MKIKNGYMLREIAGTVMVVPTGERIAEFNGIISLNETGAFLWEQLQSEKTEEELLSALCGEFEVDEATAKADITDFLASLQNGGLLE